MARLEYVDPYLASRFAFLRFNFPTGDAAGQNMVSRATLAACELDPATTIPACERFCLDSNLASDKKFVARQHPAHAAASG